MKRWLVIAVLVALVSGCGMEAPPASEQKADRFAEYNQQIARLNTEVQLRDARIVEMQKQLGLLSSRLSKCELTNKQLRLRLEAVGSAPMERDRYKKLSEEHALEIERLQNQIRALHARLATPATRPPETAEGD